MTGLLQVRIQAHLPALPAGATGQTATLPPHLVEQATLKAYADCFRVMVLAALAVTPAVVLFRIRSDETAIEPAAQPAPLARAE
jgi:acetylglutamate kinase